MNEPSQVQKEIYHRVKANWRVGLFLIPVFCGLYLSSRILYAAEGLPLDDAYIYLRYIQNILNGEGLTFNPGEVSFGITSFLYTINCVFFSKILPWLTPLRVMQWTGVFWFMIMLFFAQMLSWRISGNYWLSLFIGFLLAFCRPLLFTAPAGLETSMFSAITVILLYAALREKPVNAVWMGIGAGLLFLTRPEGLLFATGYIFFQLHGYFFLSRWDSSTRFHTLLTEIAWFTAGFLLCVTPYLVFVKIHSGFWMPTTFYGKLLHMNTFTLYPLSEQIKLGFHALLNSIREIGDQDPTSFTFYILYALTLLSLIFFAAHCMKNTPPVSKYAARATLFSFLLFPFLFGFKFHVFPQFGGYFVRYIQVLIVLIHIEAAYGIDRLLRHLLQHIPRVATQRWVVAGTSIVLSVFVLIKFMPVMLERLPFDIDFYRLHTEVNEGVRMQTALWIKDNTPPNARVLVGTTGLGVVGGFSGRYSKDEAGLINPDIHPYLKAYQKKYNRWNQMRIDHWISIMEYMKIHNISYYTSYNPLWLDTRFTEKVVEVTDPALADTEVAELTKILIYKYSPQNHYDLWAEFEDYGIFRDRAAIPVNEDRMKLTFWQEIPVIAVDVREVTAEIEAEYVFPDNAQIQFGIALDYPPRLYDPDEWVQYDIYVEMDQTRETVYSKRLPITSFTPRQTLEHEIVDLSEYSNRYGKLILATLLSPKREVGILWAGWVHPNIMEEGSTKLKPNKND